MHNDICMTALYVNLHILDYFTSSNDAVVWDNGTRIDFENPSRNLHALSFKTKVERKTTKTVV